MKKTERKKERLKEEEEERESERSKKNRPQHTFSPLKVPTHPVKNKNYSFYFSV